MQTHLMLPCPPISCYFFYKQEIRVKNGSKLKAIAVHYNTDLQGADIDASTYAIHDYGMTLSKNDLTQGTNPGIITKVYLNDKPEIASRSKSHGSYVIIETNTDYQGSRFPRSYAM